MNNCKISRFLRPAILISISIISLVVGRKTPARADTPHSLYLAQTPQLPPGTGIDDLPDSAPLPDRRQDPNITPLPPVEDFLERPPSQLPEGETTEENVEFEVKEFVLEGNTVLDPEAVEAIFQDYRDRPISFADLVELETRLTRLYAENGYINSAVVIPVQSSTKGTLIVRAVEGGVENIDVSVDGRLQESYVRSRLRRGTKTPLNIDELSEALQLLQLNPLINSLNAELSVGTSRDRWELDVDVNQGNAFDPVLFVNNYRTPSVGSFQRGLELNHNNVLGYADRFSFVYKNTDGSNDLDGSYTIPVNAMDGTVGLRYRYVDSEIVEDEFEDLGIESETDEYEFTFRQPLLLTANSQSTQEFALGLEFSRQSNTTTIEDTTTGEQIGFNLSPGADESGDTNISALRFFQDWTRRTRRDVFAARSQISAGLDIFDATVSENEADGKFVAWRGQVQWLRQLASSSNINLLVRSDIQLSSDDLVPLERFSLGGVESVRGYRQDALLGDSGLFVSAEVRIPFYRWSNGQSNISAIPFIDFGTSWSNSENINQDEDTVASFGVGLQLDLSNTLRARVDYGIPLVEVSDSDNTLQEQGLYLSLEYFPF